MEVKLTVLCSRDLRPRIVVLSSTRFFEAIAVATASAVYLRSEYTGTISEETQRMLKSDAEML